MRGPAFASAPDPFLPPHTNPVMVTARVGKTRSYPLPRDGENTALFIIAGQSLAAGTSEGLYTPTNSTKVDNLSRYTGEMLVAADPLIGQGLAQLTSQQGSPFTRVADQLVTAGKYARVVLAPVAVGGTTAAQWDASLHTLILDGYRRAAARGFAVTAVLWQLGETDSAQGTSQASYAASMSSLIGKVRDAGCIAPWMLGLSTYTPGSPSNAAVRAATSGLANGSSILLGPDTDTLGSGYRYDNQHWNVTGNVAAASLWKVAIQDAL